MDSSVGGDVEGDGTTGATSRAGGASRPSGLFSGLLDALSATAAGTSIEAIQLAHEAAMAALDRLDNAVRDVTRSTPASQADHPSAAIRLHMLVVNIATARTQDDVDQAASAAVTTLSRIESDMQPVAKGPSFQYTADEQARVIRWTQANVATLVTPHLVSCRNTFTEGVYDAFTVTCMWGVGKEIATNQPDMETADIRLLNKSAVGCGKGDANVHQMFISGGSAGALGRSRHPTPRFGLPGRRVVLSMKGDPGEYDSKSRRLLKKYKVPGAPYAALPSNHLLGYGLGFKV